MQNSLSSVVTNVEDICRRCGGELRQAAILANYKSFVVSLMRCKECGATVERKENAHRSTEPSQDPRSGTSKRANRPSRRPRHMPAERIPHPTQPREDPAPPPKRNKPAKRLERPFNVRITRRKERNGGEPARSPNAASGGEAEVGVFDSMPETAVPGADDQRGISQS